MFHNVSKKRKKKSHHKIKCLIKFFFFFLTLKSHYKFFFLINKPNTKLFPLEVADIVVHVIFKFLFPIVIIIIFFK